MNIFLDSAVVILAIVIIINVALTFFVYRHNPKSTTNKIFTMLGFVVSMWLVTSYLSYVPVTNLFWSRLTIFFATLVSVLFFLLSHTIPSTKIMLSRKIFSIISVGTVLMTGITLSPFAFVGIETVDGTSTLIPGPGMVLFGIFTTFFTLATFFTLWKKMKNLFGIEKQQLRFILFGILTMTGLLIVSVLIPVLLFQNDTFVIFIPIYTLVFLGMTAYAIFKHQLFNIKVIATESIAYVLIVVTLFDALFARDFGIFALKISIFILVLSFGILLIRSVRKEVSLREQLQEANKAQESLIHFITHQIKGFLTKSRYIFAELLEGSFGDINVEVKKIAEDGLKINTDGVSTVQTILNAANIKTGKITYDMKTLDLKGLIKHVFEKHQKTAVEKGLAYNLEITPDSPFVIKGDATQLAEAFSNLIDNSIKYTQAGGITMKSSCQKLNPPNTTFQHSTVSRSELRSTTGIECANIIFSIKDTGVGITKEDMDKIFEEGARGKNALKVNIDSTGFGLYIVKNIIEAHGGMVYVKSEGEGKGSEFVVELPSV